MVRVAVVGGGCSGIVASKTCLEYGYEVVCYEKTHDLGGLWRYKPQECDGEPSVMKSTIIDTSKEMCAYGDFPPRPEYSNFMHNRQMLQYFREYAEHFNVLPHIKYNTLVEMIKRTANFDETGQWEVTVKDTKTGKTETETFDGVMICTGHHCYTNEPDFVGLRDKFAGKVLHSHSYKDPRGFEDKNVMVVGIGNSGVDVTVELSRAANQVYLVTRRGSWVWNRVFDDGLPFDMIVNSHWYDKLSKIAPNLVQAWNERKLLKRYNLEYFGLMPAHHLMAQHPTISDELPNRIQSGMVTVKPNIKEFIGPKSCTFEDGTSVDDIDVVVLCTGYVFGFPSLESGIIPVDKNRVKLYKQMYAPDLSRPETLAVIGLVQPIGAIFPIAEMQCRVFCEYLRGKRKLPNRQAMYADIEQKLKEMRDLYVESNRHTIQVPFVPFFEELAAMIDAMPSSPLVYLLKGDPKLAWAIAFGPCMAYEFRLRGPHPWPGARDAIVNAWDRVLAPTRTRKIPSHRCANGGSPGFDCVMRKYSLYIKGMFAVFVVLMLTVVFAF